MNPLLLEGLSDAAGFLGGVLLAWWLATMLGFNPLGEGYGGNVIVGILMSGAGGGLGLQAARRWRASRKKRE